MSEPKRVPVPLHLLTPGQNADFFALLAEKTRGTSRNGKAYFQCKFRDAERVVTCMVWSDGDRFEECEHVWQPGQVYKLRATYEKHPTYGPQVELWQIRPVTDADSKDGFDPRDFLEISRFNVDEMFQELCALAEAQIADRPLRRLVSALLQKHAEPLRRLPATPKTFYPFHGGLLEHILSVTRTCLLLADRYQANYEDLVPPLNRDLIVAGAVLHDLGRVVELAGDAGNVQQTVPGQLIGHIFLGRDLVRDMARELGDIDSELLQLLEHMILSHLIRPEWGSPRLPQIPECLILHHADDLDAKLEMFTRCLRKDQETGPFTARDPVLGKPLFKGRKS